MKQSTHNTRPRGSPRLTDERKAEILEYYIENRKNSIGSIAKLFGVTYYKVDVIINTYFKSIIKIRK